MSEKIKALVGSELNRARLNPSVLILGALAFSAALWAVYNKEEVIEAIKGLIKALGGDPSTVTEDNNPAKVKWTCLCTECACENEIANPAWPVCLSCTNGAHFHAQK